MLINLEINFFKKDKFYFSLNNVWYNYDKSDKRLFLKSYIGVPQKDLKIGPKILISDKILIMLGSSDTYQQIIALKLIENKAKIKLL